MMNVDQWALQIVASSSLEDKLYTPDTITYHPFSPISIDEPVRSSQMSFQKRSKKEKLPKIHELDQESNRAVCLHRFCGHELLAVEIMANAILSFPDAPVSFLKTVVHTLKEEQEHVRLYMELLHSMGLDFGSLPLYKHFWSHVKYLHEPINYVSMMNLTFEMANLDFAPMYGQAFFQYGDVKAGELMARVFKDEIRHVRSGWQWLNKFKAKDQDAWQAWNASLTPICHPRRAKGPQFHDEGRLKAGISPAWIDQLKEIR